MNTDILTTNLSTFSEGEKPMSYDEGMELNLMIEQYAPLGLIECVDGKELLALHNILEEFNDAMHEINVLELTQMSYHDSVAIFEAMAGGDSLWDKFIKAAKTFFTRMLEAITMAWNWVMKMLDKYVMSNNLFLKKYEKLLDPKKIIEFNGYKFQNLEAPKVYKVKVPDTIDKDTSLLPTKGANDTDISMEHIKSEITREITAGKIASVMTNPSQEIHDLYYGRLDSSATFVVGEQLDILKNTKQDQKHATVPFKAAVIEMKTLAFTLSKLGSLQNAEDSKKFMQYVELCKYNVEVLYAAYTQYAKAIVDRSNQARAICIQALQELTAERKEAENESHVTFTTSRSSLNELSLE